MTSADESHGLLDVYGAATALTAAATDPLSPMNVGGMYAQPITSPARAGRRSISSWDEKFQELKQYRLEHGDVLVPGRYKDNPSLGRWVESQRKQFRLYTDAKNAGRNVTCALNDDKVALLEGIGFAWSVRGKGTSPKPGYNKPSLSWEGRLAQLKAYRQANNDCNVPYHYPDDEGFGRWVANQRTWYRAYMKEKQEASVVSATKEQRIAELEELGFDFSPPRASKRKATSPPVPVPAPLPVAAEAAAAAPEEPFDEDAGNPWVLDDDFGEGYIPESDELQAGADPSQVLPPKKRRKTSQAARQKKEASEKKPPRGDFGDKDSKRKVWNERFEELKEYKAKHGNCDVPGRFSDNPALGRWVETQRKQFHRYMKAKQEGKTESYTFAIGMDEEDRIAKLTAVGFSWTLRSGPTRTPGSRYARPTLSWNQRLTQLKAFKEETGHCLVPHSHPPCPSLGVWVANQRTWFRLYMKAKQEAEDQASVISTVKEQRIIELNALGFDWAPPRSKNSKAKENGKLKKTAGAKNKTGSSKSKKTKEARKAKTGDEQKAKKTAGLAAGNVAV